MSSSIIENPLFSAGLTIVSVFILLVAKYFAQTRQTTTLRKKITQRVNTQCVSPSDFKVNSKLMLKHILQSSKIWANQGRTPQTQEELNQLTQEILAQHDSDLEQWEVARSLPNKSKSVNLM